ncbi:MAG: hypothetical protein JEZ06_24825, partial [Anaerolineaceae bacterium]|nr:hypothetical protein [Anaerolineaceae bacterium]
MIFVWFSLALNQGIQGQAGRMDQLRPSGSRQTPTKMVVFIFICMGNGGMQGTNDFCVVQPCPDGQGIQGQAGRMYQLQASGSRQTPTKMVVFIFIC